jgi:branched-chain amino acid transport system ATP-binding protein
MTTDGLMAEDVVAGYSRVDVLRGCSLHVRPGERVALVGPNGAGKSTLFRVMSGMLANRGGTVWLDGRSCNGQHPNTRGRHGVVYVPEGKCVFPGLSVEDNLELGAVALGYDVRDAGLAHAFELFPILSERRTQAAGTLSGGEQRMLAIARGLMSRARYLLLDEPSIGLAPLLVQQLGDACRILSEEGIAIVLAEQNLCLVERMGGQAHLMRWGRIEQEVDAANIRSNEEISRAVLGSQMTA